LQEPGGREARVCEGGTGGREEEGREGELWKEVVMHIYLKLEHDLLDPGRLKGIPKQSQVPNLNLWTLCIHSCPPSGNKPEGPEQNPLTGTVRLMSSFEVFGIQIVFNRFGVVVQGNSRLQISV
jgi:hypothetical protein